MFCIAFLSIAHKFCFHVESEYRTTSDATFVRHFDFLRMQKLCKIVMLAEKTCLLKPANRSYEGDCERPGQAQNSTRVSAH
jgi:hypothetical protein